MRLSWLPITIMSAETNNSVSAKRSYAYRNTQQRSRLRALTASLPSAGTIERIACGARTRSVTTLGVIPSACPATTWPRSTPRTLPRMISAMKGASFSARANPPASTAVSFTRAKAADFVTYLKVYDGVLVAKGNPKKINGINLSRGSRTERCFWPMGRLSRKDRPMSCCRDRKMRAPRNSFKSWPTRRLLKRDSKQNPGTTRAPRWRAGPQTTGDKHESP
jgi:hypothetical protein